MATSLTTRETAGGGATVKNAPLTNAEVDLNFISLADNKIEIVDGTVAVIPTGTTAERPSTPVAGYLRFNETDNVFEGYDGTEWGSIGGGGVSYTFHTANYTAEAGEGVLTDTTGGSFTVTLPASPDVGDTVVIADAGGAWNTNNLTIARNGSTIDGNAQDIVTDISNIRYSFIYNGTTWNIYTAINNIDSDVVTANSLSPVATTGIYDDIINAPVLSTVATSGSYTDLSNTPTIGNSTISVTGGNGLTGSGSFNLNDTTATTITINHNDTSSQASVNNSGTTVIQDVTLDDFGHVTNLSNKTISSDDLSLGTSNNVRFNSLGVGTNASGASGEIRATNNITAFYSDDRLKTRIAELTDAVEKISTLDTFYFEPNQTAQDMGYEKTRDVGVSAQQVQMILPEIVVPAPIDDKYLTVRYEKMIPLLLQAIKELKTEIDLLKEEKNDY